MEQHLKALQVKREQIAAAIEAEYARPYPDGTRLSRLKRVKLALRDRMIALERLWGSRAPKPVRAPLGFPSAL